MNIRKIFAAALMSVAIMLPAAAVTVLPGTSSQPQFTAYADDYDYEEYLDEYDFDDYDDYDSAPSKSSETKEKKKFNPVKSFIIALIISLIIAGIAVGSMYSKLKTVHKKDAASDYKKEGSFVLENSSDNYLYKKVSKTKRSS
ncbi:MAG: hypothetical protein IKO47_10205 [Ruminococcus sp.]|nr:hypothetical protein [Ruminococcus sp.]